MKKTLIIVITIIAGVTLFILSDIIIAYRSQTMKEEMIRNTPDANGFIFYDTQKIELGAKINYHTARLIESHKTYAIYSYFKPGGNPFNDYYKFKIENGIIVEIKRYF